jgi:hypothetical protein
MAGRALAAYKGARRLFNTEFKVHDVADGGGTAVSTTPTVTLLSGIAEGDGTAARNGNSVKIESAFIRWGGQLSSSASRTRMRVMIVVDTRCQELAPAASDVVAIDVSCYRLPNLTTDPGRYIVVWDQVVTLDEGSGLNKFYEKDLTPALGGMHLLYSGTGALVSSCSGPHIFMIQYSSEATNTPASYYAMRIRYVDN